MNGFKTRLLLMVLAAVFAPASFIAPQASAQGFSSVSSATPVAAPPSEDGSAATPAPAPAPAPTPSTASSATGEPAAQLASNGFGSAAGAAPNLPVPDALSRSSAAGSSEAFEHADKVLVDKSDRRLYLLKHDRVIAEYPIKLGLNPYGHKQQEGDFRTPEGRYTLNRRNPRSEFFLAIQVSYPNREDAAWAKENGWSPGGLIMIHGQPNIPKRPAEFYASRDWTDGCIALSNTDMVDVWLRTSVGIPIEIRP
jgi:lipoprotein-anchoring transpeptidase ErfK/SrfK